jgi:hypothetical protein
MASSVRSKSFSNRTSVANTRRHLGAVAFVDLIADRCCGIEFHVDRFTPSGWRCWSLWKWPYGVPNLADIEERMWVGDQSLQPRMYTKKAPSPDGGMTQGIRLAACPAIELSCGSTVSRPPMSKRSESNGGGGNCTRVPSKASYLPHSFCEQCTQGLSDLCRDFVALRALVAAWHGMTPEVRHAIMELARSCRPVE